MTFRAQPFFLFLGLALPLACSAASDDDDGSEPDGGSETDGNSTDGNSTDGGSTGGRGSGGEDEPNACFVGVVDPDCEDAAMCPYERCEDEITQCYGDLLGGDFDGPCQGLATCQAACGTEESCDAACVQQCQTTASCQTCVETTVNPCVFQECFELINNCGSSGSGDGRTCSDLLACCNSLSGTDKESCRAQYDTVVSSGDEVCDLVYENFITQGLCE